MSIDPTVLQNYELEANQALQNALCQLPRGQKTGSARVVEVRDTLGALRQKLLQQLQAVNVHLSTFDKLDERHKVRALMPTQSYPQVDVAAIIAGTDKKPVIKTGELPEALVTLASQYMTNREMEYAGKVLVEATGLNADVAKVEAERKRNTDLILGAVSDILAGKSPALNLVVRGLHTVEGLSKLMKGADAAKLDLIITFLIDHCPDLRSLDFKEAHGLSVGLMDKLKSLESLRFERGNVSDKMIHALAVTSKSLKRLEFKWCEHITAAAFTAQDKDGVTYAAHMRQLTHLKIDYPTRELRDGDVLLLVQAMPELTGLSLVYHSTLTHQAVTHIAHHAKKLEALDLSLCKFGDAAFAAPDPEGITNAERLKGLIVLDLFCVSGMTDRALHAIATHMTALTNLGCPMLHQISENTAAVMIRNLQQLTTLRFGACMIEPSILKTLVSGLSQLVHLDLCELKGNLTAAIGAIAPYLARLTHFHMAACQSRLVDALFIAKDRAGVTVIERMKNLISLDLSDSNITDKTALEIIKHCKQLMHLKLKSLGYNALSETEQQLMLHFPFVQLHRNKNYDE